MFKLNDNIFNFFNLRFQHKLAKMMCTRCTSYKKSVIRSHIQEIHASQMDFRRLKRNEKGINENNRERFRYKSYAIILKSTNGVKLKDKTLDTRTNFILHISYIQGGN